MRFGALARVFVLVKDKANLEGFDVDFRCVMEGLVDGASVSRICSGQRREDESGIFRASRKYSDLVHRPAECHRAMTADSAEGWAKSRYAALPAWRYDRAERFRADRIR